MTAGHYRFPSNYIPFHTIELGDSTCLSFENSPSSFSLRNLATSLILPSFWRKLPRWHEEHHRGEDTKAHEIEKPSHSEKRDDQQTQTLPLALGELQRAMDPPIAVRVYNNRFCPLISRLPEVLLLCICDFLCDDFAAVLCRRIGSRMFLRLPDSEYIFLWGHRFISPSSGTQCQAPV